MLSKMHDTTMKKIKNNKKICFSVLQSIEGEDGLKILIIVVDISKIRHVQPTRGDLPARGSRAQTVMRPASM